MRRYVVRTTDEQTALATLEADLGDNGWDATDLLLPLVKKTAATARVTGRVEVVLMPDERHLCSWDFRNGQCEGWLQVSLSVLL